MGKRGRSGVRTFFFLLLGAALESLSAAPRPAIQANIVSGGLDWSALKAAYEKTHPDAAVAIKNVQGPASSVFNGAQEPPDIVYGSIADPFSPLLQDRFISYRPAGWASVPARLKDSSGLWWTIHVASIVFVVNTAALGDAPAPQSFADLLDPRYKNKIVYEDPRASSVSLAFVLGVNPLMGGDATLNAGFGYLKKLDSNIRRYTNRRSAAQSIFEEIPILITATAGPSAAGDRRSSTIEIVSPREGAIVVPFVVGLLKAAPHPAEAKLYLDWLLTPEAQELMTSGVSRRGSPTPNVLSAADVSAEARLALRRWQSEIGGRETDLDPF